MTNIAVVVGSVRRESINRKLAEALTKLAPAGFTFSWPSIGDLPMFNQDLEASLPAEVVRFKGEIAAADAVLIVTPEYNRSIPPLLKNALDWGSRPYGKNSWSGKPGAIIGTTQGAIGTAVAQSHLRHICITLNIALMGQPEAFIVFKKDLVDGAGAITDEGVAKFLQGYMDGFVKWVERTGKK